MIDELKDYARENNVPIMMDDGIEFLCNYIKENKYKKILEVGTAIGYSAIMMSNVDSTIKITTLEKDEVRYNIAVQNIKKFNKENQIESHLVDALEYILEDNFDLIFIDAAKSKNIPFFEKFSKYLNKGGSIVTDNMLFHGLVEDSEMIETKNQKKLVEKIIKYKEYLDTNKDYKTIHYSLGDGVSVTKRVGE